MIKYDAKSNTCFKCDLCGGDPQCVKFCPMGALVASWIETDDGDAEESMYTVEITGSSRTWTHYQETTLALSDASAGAQIDGVVWTSHATHSSIVLGIFDVWADAYDEQGNLLATSEKFHGEIPEMQSFEFSLSLPGVASSSIAKITLHISGENVSNVEDKGL